mmetsp:Transcript_4784/g.13782  ORF Transcript_4784/g.13782 Transcript_4784/m.13782 type:complete len:216 (+) Transcript_4784:264-911(+)
MMQRVEVKVERVDDRPDGPMTQHGRKQHFACPVGGLVQDLRRGLVLVVLLWGRVVLNEVGHHVVSVDVARRGQCLVQQDLDQRVGQLGLLHRNATSDEGLQEVPPVVQPKRCDNAEGGPAARPRQIVGRIGFRQILGGAVAGEKNERCRRPLDGQRILQQRLGVPLPKVVKEPIVLPLLLLLLVVTLMLVMATVGGGSVTRGRGRKVPSLQQLLA